MGKLDVRLNFIKKVYLILATQLLVTAVYSGVVMKSHSLQKFMVEQ